VYLDVFERRRHQQVDGLADRGAADGRTPAQDQAVVDRGEANSLMRTLSECWCWMCGPFMEFLSGGR
jgi:hypothetical protein